MAKTPVSLNIPEFSQKEREVAKFSMTFTQMTDQEGQVTALPQGGKIYLKMKVLNSGNTDLVRWMTDKMKAVNGKIVFYDTTNGVLMKSIDFTDAYCVGYTETWEDATKPGEDLSHIEEITISCREIKISGMELFKNTWELYHSMFE